MMIGEEGSINFMNNLYQSEKIQKQNIYRKLNTQESLEFQLLVAESKKVKLPPPAARLTLPSIDVTGVSDSMMKKNPRLLSVREDSAISHSDITIKLKSANSKDKSIRPTSKGKDRSITPIEPYKRSEKSLILE